MYVWDHKNSIPLLQCCFLDSVRLDLTVFKVETETLKKSTTTPLPTLLPHHQHHDQQQQQQKALEFDFIIKRSFRKFMLVPRFSTADNLKQVGLYENGNF